MNHLRRARDEIDRRCEPLDIPTLARTALASEAYFVRTFKREYGETRRGRAIGVAAMNAMGAVRQLVQPHGT
jgi:hypothetical protein